MAPRVVASPRRHRRSDGSATARREHCRLREDIRATRDDHCTSVRHRVTEMASGAQTAEAIRPCRNVSTRATSTRGVRTGFSGCRMVGQFAEHPTERSCSRDSGTCLQHAAFGDPVP